MPHYSFRCPKCGKITTEWLKVDDRNREVNCSDCDVQKKRIIGHGLQPDIIEGNRERIKKAVPPGVNRETLDRDWMRDT